MTLIYLTLCWVLGIVSAYLSHQRLPYGVMGFVFGACFCFVWPHPRYRRLAMLAACGACFAFGGWRMEIARPMRSASHVVHLNNQGVVTLYGVVRREPQVYDSYTNVLIEVDEALALGRMEKRQGQVLVRFPAYSEVAYGDRVMVTGELHAPPRLDAFDYREKLARQGIFSSMSPQYSRILGHGEGSKLAQILIDLRQEAKRNINHALPEPQASLLNGILLGDENGMPSAVKEAFQVTGSSHIIAISGFNMALIAQIISLSLGKIWRSKWGVWALSLAFIGGYAVFVGANGGVLRAAVMSGVLISAPLLGRSSYIPASLSFTALILSIYDPYILWDIGFQMSFAAVLGMALLVPSVNRAFRDWMRRGLGEQWGREVAGFLAEPLVVGLVAQLFTLPLVLFYFGRFSWVGLFVNLLVVPVQPLILILGGMATLVSFISPTVGLILYQGVWLCLAWTTEIVRRCAELPIVFSEFSLSAEVLGLCMVGVVGVMILNAERPVWYERWWRYWRKHLPKLGVQVLVPIVLLVLLGNVGQQMVRRSDGKLRVAYLDMGQSNSVLVQSPNGAVFLIDGGRFPSQLLTALGDRLPPAKRQIEMVWISSDEPDDIGALLEVIRRYEVKAVVSSVGDSQASGYLALVAELVRRDIPLLDAVAGWRVETGDGLRWEILSPYSGEAASEGLVLRLEYGDAVFLFTHRLTASNEISLMQNAHLIQASVLQAAEHAADNSNSLAWIEAVNPQVVIVQNDPSSRQVGAIGHVMARFEGRKVFRTDKNGHIDIVTDGETLQISTEY